MRRAPACPLRTGALQAGAFLVLTTLLLAAPAAAAKKRSGGNGTFFIGTYEGAVYVVDEATFAVRKKIPVEISYYDAMVATNKGRRIYAKSADLERFTVIDIGSEAVERTFTLDEGRTHVKVWRQAFDPSDSYALMTIKRMTKQRDRFEIGPPTLVRYDLRGGEIEEVPWPEKTEREFANFLFSPDGKYVFFLAEEIIVFDAATFEEVDRWALSRALQSGMGTFNFEFNRSVYEEPGYFTDLFHLDDPVQHRKMMGVARVDLAGRDVDFFMLGPSQKVSFALSPDRSKAYGLHQEVGNYQIWTFDLARRRVESKREFEGRPRMSLLASSNGELLYIYGAGHTFDVHDARTFELLRTEELDADMLNVVLVPGAKAGS